MTQEEKELLIRDICARLPYGVYIKFKQYNEPLYLSVKDRLSIYNGGELINNLQYLYLRPLSSMTEEEYAEYFGRTMTIDIVETSRQVIDWLNAHHFDYRGLIKKGLALEATKDMY